MLFLRDNPKHYCDVSVTLDKNDFLHDYPEIFAKLVWVDKGCVVSLQWENDDSYGVSSAGTMDIIEIPKSIINKYTKTIT